MQNTFPCRVLNLPDLPVSGGDRDGLERGFPGPDFPVGWWLGAADFAAGDRSGTNACLHRSRSVVERAFPRRCSLPLSHEAGASNGPDRLKRAFPTCCPVAVPAGPPDRADGLSVLERAFSVPAVPSTMAMHGVVIAVLHPAPTAGSAGRRSGARASRQARPGRWHGAVA